MSDNVNGALEKLIGTVDRFIENNNKGFAELRTATAGTQMQISEMQKQLPEMKKQTRRMEQTLQRLVDLEVDRNGE